MHVELNIAADAPWRKRFEAPAIQWSQVAILAPQRGLVATNRSGKVQLYTWDVASGDLRQLTDTPTGKPLGWISPDGQYIFYHQDDAGNEIGHWVRIPYEGGEPIDVTPDVAPYAVNGLHFSDDGRWLGWTQAGDQGFEVCVLANQDDSTSDAPRRIFHSQAITQGPLLSADGQLAVVATAEGSNKAHYRLVALDASTGERIGELWDGPDASVMPARWSPLVDDGQVLAVSNRSGVNRPLLWNPRTGERLDLPLPEIEGDLAALDWSHDGQHLLLCQIWQAVQRFHVYDIGKQELVALDHPAGSFGFYGGGLGIYFGPAGTIYTTWQDAVTPPQLIELDATSGKRLRTVLEAGPVPSGQRWRSISFHSSDGQAIQGWLGVPDGTGPYPTVLETHGGPTAAQMEVFSPVAQAWLDHGFAFLSINYRGSTTFGRQFQDQIIGDLGHWEVEDMAAAQRWLVEHKIARPDSILLTGGSYGGYLTLMGLGKRPDLWAGGMASIAVADWIIQYEDTAGTLRGYQVALLGGTPAEQREQYIASSPITYVEQVEAPVLVIQGRNDTRCPARPMEMYEAKMQALGKQIEVEWFGAGHGSRDVGEQIHHQELKLRFAYRVLG